ncbi:H-NS histone family protein [Rhodalgimonas zhirmunskyi]|uniref:H-NS histone family protein n=1 Tax=Rhodalgimonas zhirmunskyi TaxID=2964767 RepID=A0AAJ1U6F7_9RHOB|nr:H-NS histone family protein [Rhodoalgimonas zhirmunskyi]MDQ2094480.1 H-NS histone family protein [Rhodoalgimonas zhirmunskyi]
MTNEERITMGDLTSMSLTELQSLQKKVAKAIEKQENRDRKKALAALEATARDLGYSLSELTGGKKAPGSKGAPKYANPENPEQTWTGKGRRPAWVNEALQSGKSLEEMAI